MTWIFEKFISDGAIYSFCPICGFHYFCGSSLNMDEGIRQYNYCPMCGEFLHFNRNEIEVIWNERDILELYTFEEDQDRDVSKFLSLED